VEFVSGGNYIAFSTTRSEPRNKALLDNKDRSRRVYIEGNAGKLLHQKPKPSAIARGFCETQNSL